MTDTGGPAFPIPVKPGVMAGSDGMTLRDYFAAQVLASRQLIPVSGIVSALPRDFGPADFGARVAAHAYAIADAMLKARAK